MNKRISKTKYVSSTFCLTEIEVKGERSLAEIINLRVLDLHLSTDIIFDISSRFCFFRIQPRALPIDLNS